MVVDIGGGSTEVTWGLGHRFDGGRSLNIGTIKLIEGPLQGDPPAPEALDQTRDEIDRQLVRVTPLGHLAHYYGTAGSFTHLAAVDLALREYDPVKIARHKLTRENVARWIDRLSRMNRREILALPGVDPRRADVLLAGSIIIERLCEKFQVPAFEVMDRGIRFGKLFDMLRGFEGPIIFSS
jgi:exopolyphosphatase/guanosine-5'-triphosphate,3'-diphosphate pyrophosphatase